MMEKMEEEIQKQKKNRLNSETDDSNRLFSTEINNQKI